MSAREKLVILLASYRDAEGKVDAYRLEVLSEVADMLMAADETSAALLVDRLRDGGQR